MAKFMLLLRGGEAGWAALTPEEMQRAIQAYVAWGEQLRAEGRLLDADELHDGGTTIRTRGGTPTVDGPYTETKERIGGYYLITAADLAEAAEVAKGCPILITGGLVEVREIKVYPEYEVAQGQTAGAAGAN